MHQSLRLAPRIAGLLAAALLAHVAPAQLPDWAPLSVSPSASVHCEWTYADVTDGNTVHAFSSLNHRWISLQTSAAPLLGKYNDFLVVQDGTDFYGFSPRAGRFEHLATTSGAPVNVLPGGSLGPTWSTVVVDGNDADVFLGYEGVWRRFTFSRPPAALVGRMCVILDDGSGLYGVSAFYGTLIPLGVPGATVPALSQPPTTDGIATSPGFVHGFSAHQNRWTSLAVSGTPVITQAPGSSQSTMVEILDGSTMSFYSGFTGTFATLPAGAGAVLDWDRSVAVVRDGSIAYGYSAVRGTWASIPVSANTTVQVRRSYAVLQQPGGITAFSEATGEFTSQPGNLVVLNPSGYLATLAAPGAQLPAWVYSSVTDQFVAVPQVSPASIVYQVDTALAIEDDVAGGLYGFSARGTGWAFQPMSTPDQVVVDPVNATVPSHLVVAQQGTQLAAFNPRTGAWRSRSTSAPMATINIENSIVLCLEANQVHAFSDLTDRWSTIAISSPGAQSVSEWITGFVFDAGTVQAYSGIGQLITDMDYPDTWRIPVAGSPLRVDIGGESGALGVLGISNGLATPFQSETFFPLTRIPFQLSAEGLAHFDLALPSTPGAAGGMLHLQALVRKPNGRTYFTNATTVYLP